MSEKNLILAVTIMKDITICHVAKARKLEFYKPPSFFTAIYYQIPNAVNIISYVLHKCLFFSFCAITIMLESYHYL